MEICDFLKKPTVTRFIVFIIIEWFCVDILINHNLIHEIIVELNLYHYKTCFFFLQRLKQKHMVT